MLLAQMSAIHAALMKFSGDLARAETALEVESLTRAVNQLARVYVIQYDAFNRHHNGIEHKSGAKRFGLPRAGEPLSAMWHMRRLRLWVRCCPRLHQRSPMTEGRRRKSWGDARRDPETVSAKNKREA